MKKILFLSVLLLGLVMFASANIPSAAAQATSYTSCFQLQNLEGNAANIVLNYYAQGNSSPVASPSDSIPANGSKTYCPLSAVPAGFNGSVVINSDRQLASIANVSGAASGTPNFSAYNASYSGFTGGATTVSLPLLMKGNFGYNTWFNVQNVGSANASVTVNYSDGTSAGPFNIGVGQSRTFNQATETHSQTVFAGTITSSGSDVVATVMQVGPNTSPLLFAYNGFTSSSTNPVMPLVQANNFGYTTGIQIQNTGNSATSVTVSYTPSDVGTACTETRNIPAGASATFALNAWSNNNGNNCVNGQTFVGSARVTGNSAGHGLVGIVNQHNFAANKGASYSAFDASSASSKVVLPLIMDRNFGYFTGFNIQNVGNSNTNVSCTFTGSSVTVPSTTLQPGKALTAVQLNQLANGYVGSATCTASGNGEIIAVVNQLLGTGAQDTFLVYEGTNN